MAGIEGEAVSLEDGGVPGRLHGVDVMGDETFFGFGGGGGEGGLGGRGGGDGGGGVEVEAEEGVCVEVIEGGPGAVPFVC